MTNKIENLYPLVREISRAKHRVIMNKCKNNLEREYHIRSTRKIQTHPDSKIIQMILLLTFSAALLWKGKIFFIDKSHKKYLIKL
jgi:hypothetical protein